MGMWLVRGWRLSAMRVLVVAVPVGLGLVAFVETVLIGHAAVHLCGWPATISCEHGLPVAWTVLRGLMWAFALIAAADALRFSRDPTGDAALRVFAWAGWGPVLLLVTVGTAIDRRVQLVDIIAGSGLLLVGCVIAGAGLAARLPVPERRVAVALAPLLLVIATAPFWAPPAFEQVAVWEPARRDHAQRIEAERCRRGIDQGPRAGALAGELPACEL